MSDQSTIPEPKDPDTPSRCGGRRPSSGYAITQSQLEDILIHEGIICGDAIEDPYGYDGGMTELRVSIATREINALLRHNASDEPRTQREKP